jgi:hypothetical protein
MSESFAIAYTLIRAGWIALVVFGVLLLVALVLAMLLGDGLVKTAGLNLSGAGFLVALALLSGGALLEGLLSGEAYFVLRKSGGLVKLADNPGWYWGSVLALGLLCAGMLALSAAAVWRAFKPVRRSALYET